MCKGVPMNPVEHPCEVVTTSTLATSLLSKEIPLLGARLADLLVHNAMGDYVKPKLRK